MSRTCKACGWVAFGVTREYAERQVAEFNAYFNTLSPEKQMENYGGKGATIANYERCVNCGGSYKNFRESRPEDCGPGVTLNPIIVE